MTLIDLYFKVGDERSRKVGVVTLADIPDLIDKVAELGMAESPESEVSGQFTPLGFEIVVA